MIDRNQKNQHLRSVVRRLLEAETGEDAMICHDGGFRYSGDFISMESNLIEPASILSQSERRELTACGFIEVHGEGESTIVRVTEAGRGFAFEDDAAL